MKRAPIPALLAVLAAELFLFQSVAVPRHAWIYPRWWDQIQYLTNAYQGYECARGFGLLAAARQLLTTPSPQGTLYGFAALPIFLVAGPSRGAALAVNMAAFLALQTATFLSVRRLSRSHSLAFASIALLAALHSPWSGEAGSAFDFRLDWMAACAYGIALAAAIAGNGFRSTRWAVAFGGAVGLVMLTRSLTAVYFAVIYFAFAGILLTQPERWRRGGRLLLSGAIAAALFGPVFLLKRHDIYGYYWMGQIKGPESAWHDSHLGPAASVAWIFSHLVIEQIGLPAVAIAVCAAIALLVLRRGTLGPADRPAVPRPSPGGTWTAALVFLAAPAAVLTLHVAKAPQPVSILIAPSVWISVLVWLRLAEGVSPRRLAAIGAAVFLAGTAVFASALARKPYPDQVASDARKVNALVDYLFYRSEECGLAHPRVAVTLLSDGLSPQGFRVLGYERHHQWLDIYVTLPTGLFETTPDTIGRQLAASDFVCLAQRVAGLPTGPFDVQMMGLFPANRRWCEANLRRVGNLEADGLSVSVYERGNLERLGGGPAADPSPVIGPGGPDFTRQSACPPEPPHFVSFSHLLCSTQGDCAFRLRAAYSPVVYAAAGLPAGLKLESASGWIRGRPDHAGTVAARVTAKNSLGSTTSDFTIQVEDSGFIGLVNAPAKCMAGAPVEIRYEAFDSDGKLDFIDVTDQTTQKLLDRVPAGDEEGRSWQGRFRTTFSQPGTHALSLRFVRYDPREKAPYAFFDRYCEIRVAAAP